MASNPITNDKAWAILEAINAELPPIEGAIGLPFAQRVRDIVQENRRLRHMADKLVQTLDDALTEIDAAQDKGVAYP